MKFFITSWQGQSRQEDEIPPPEFHIPQNMIERSCPYRFCRPCIASETNGQFWWVNGGFPASTRNHGFEKRETQMFLRNGVRGVLNDPETNSTPIRQMIKKRFKKCVLSTEHGWATKPSRCSVSLPIMGIKVLYSARNTLVLFK